MRGLLLFLVACGSAPAAPTPDAGAPDVKMKPPPDPGRVQLSTLETSKPFGVAVDASFVYYSSVDEGIFRVPKLGGAIDLLAADDHGPHVIVEDQDFIYAGDLGTPATDFTDGRVVRVSKGGGELVLLASGLASAGMLALLGDTLFFTTIGTRSYGAYNNDGAIWRMPKDGSSAPVRLAKDQRRPSGMAVDAAYVYWANENAGTIQRCAIGGCNEAPEQLYDQQNVPRSLTVDAAFLYWTNQQGTDVMRAPKAPGGTPQEIAGSRGFPESIVATSTELFWTETLTHSVQRMPKDGSARPSALADDLGLPMCVVVDQAGVYFSDQGLDGPKPIKAGVVRLPR